MLRKHAITEFHISAQRVQNLRLLRKGSGRDAEGSALHELRCADAGEGGIEVKEIPLSRGKFAIVDDEDFEELSKYKWHYHPHSFNPQKGYAARGVMVLKNKERKLFMHRQIMGPSDSRVDHRNRDTLDNRKQNLRFATSSQNSCNAGISRGNTTGFKGVSFFKRYRLFTARIKVLGVSNFLGYFDSAEEAGEAYRIASASLHGEFSGV